MALVDIAVGYTGTCAVPWTVPPLVTEVTFRLWGAAGGLAAVNGSGAQGLNGATGAYASAPNADPATVRQNGGNAKSLVGYVDVTLPVTPGDTYYFTVGGAGGHGNSHEAGVDTNGGAGGFNGGGAGGYSEANVLGESFPAGGGGGMTDIRHGGTSFSANAIIVAGGGGGNAYGPAAGRSATINPITPDPPYNLYDNTATYTGGSAYASGGVSYGAPGGSSASGAAASGGDALTTAGGDKIGSGGKGGSQSAGGAGGIGPAQTDVTSGSPGSLGAGGAGANGGTSGVGYFGFAGGGGGGAGHYGGGGGSSSGQITSSTIAGGGGGGGSNFIASGISATVNISTSGVYPVHPLFGQPVSGAPQKAYGSPNGQIAVEYAQPPNAPTILAPMTGATVAANAGLVLEWEFASLVTGGFQSAYDLQYSVHGAGIWTSLAIETLTPVVITGGQPQTTIFQATIPSGTFTAGTSYDIQLRVYDTANFKDVLDSGVPQGTLGDVSDWTLITVAAVTLPGAATITTPASEAILTADTAVVVDWTIPTGTESNVQILIEQPPGSGTFVYNKTFPSSRVNMCPNPSFETDASSWTEVTGNGTPTIAQSTTAPEFGTHSGKISWDSTGDATQALGFSIATVPGEVYTVAVYAASENVGTDPQVEVLATNADGTIIEQSLASNFVTNGVHVLLTTKFFAQEAITYISMSPVTTPAASTSCYIDGMIVENGFYGDGIYFGDAPLPYFDGGNANSQSGTPTWDGTTNKSISSLEVSNLLTATLDLDGSGDGVLRTAAASGPANIVMKYTLLWNPAVWSTPVCQPIILNLDPPGVPVGTLVVDDDEGTISLQITTDAGSELTVTESGDDTYYTFVTTADAVTIVPGVGDTILTVTSSDADITVVDNEDGTVTVTIDYDSLFATATCDVYRTDLTNNTPEIRIATGLVPVDSSLVFVDYTPATLTEYAYRVRAYSIAGGFEDVDL